MSDKDAPGRLNRQVRPPRLREPVLVAVLLGAVAAASVGGFSVWSRHQRRLGVEAQERIRAALNAKP